MKSKLSKDQIQKSALAGLFLLGPLEKSKSDHLRNLGDLTEKLAAADPQLRKVARLEEAASADGARFQQLQQQIPAGAPVAWFPPKLMSFFESRRVQVTTVRQANSFIPHARELAGFILQDWSVDIPETDYATFGAAIAALENENPLSMIKHLKLATSTDASPEIQAAALTVSTILHREKP